MTFVAVEAPVHAHAILAIHREDPSRFSQVVAQHQLISEIVAWCTAFHGTAFFLHSQIARHNHRIKLARGSCFSLT